MSKGSVYLTYYSKADKLENCYKVAISRWLPSFIRKANKIYETTEKGMYAHLLEFSPDEKTLVKYKANKISFEELAEEFSKYLKRETKCNVIIKNIQKILEEGQDIAFVCYEKDVNVCHRKIIGDLFSNMGYNVIIF